MRNSIGNCRTWLESNSPALYWASSLQQSMSKSTTSHLLGLTQVDNDKVTTYSDGKTASTTQVAQRLRQTECYQKFISAQLRYTQDVGYKITWPTWVM